MFDVKTHNGIITIQKISNGNHRTLRIKTKSQKAVKYPGSRLVELLVGPDKYEAFGYICKYSGEVRLWRSYQNSETFLFYKKFLENPHHFAHLVKINFEGRCRKCNKPLTTPESCESGLGPVCSGRQAA